MTQDYYSTKRITAWSQEREGQPGKAIKYQDGYTSWCPIDIFERDYQPIDSLTFGHAIDALKRGNLVARKGWNGKGMFLWLNKGSTPGAAKLSLLAGVNVGLYELSGQSTEVRLPNINMRTSDGSILTGWLASQTDMLADDWIILD